MRTENKGGDTLAAGGVRCQFQPAGSRLTQAQWAAIWEPEVSNEDGNGSPNVEASGDVGADSGASQPD